MSTIEFPPPQLKAAAEEVASLLKSRGETICVAETAAGGLISSSLLSTPGASRFYSGGLTLYTLASRIAFAGWTQQNIDDYDGPTPRLVEGLASNAREKLKATYCIGEVRSISVREADEILNALTHRSLAQQDRPHLANPPTDNRESFPILLSIMITDADNRGYVALAVVSERGSSSKDLDTGLGGDRQANMVAFAVEALKLVKQFIEAGESKI